MHLLNVRVAPEMMDLRNGNLDCVVGFWRTSADVSGESSYKSHSVRPQDKLEFQVSEPLGVSKWRALLLLRRATIRHLCNS